MKTSTKISLIVTGILVAAVLLFVAVVMVQNQTRPLPEANPSSGLPATVRVDSHRLNEPENSTVTFVEFLDFECEACGAAYPYIESLREEFGDRVTFVMRYFPLPGHGNSQNAAVAVEAAANQGQLEPMYQRMFETQLQWGEKGEESQAPLFRTFAEELGLDMVQFDADVADPATLERVMSDFQDGRLLGVQGTPTIFVNDVKLELTAIDDIRTAIVNALGE